VFEFLPPKLTILQQFAAKYSSGRLRTAGAVAAGIVAIVLLAFLVQQIELSYYRSQWKGMEKKVTELQDLQAKIHQFQPWYDPSFRDLAILRQLTLAFPETGVMTAKNIAIDENSGVTCSGNAQDKASVLAMQAKLSAAEDVSGVKVDLFHGKNPMQFTFHFQYGNGGAQ
jgi:hypothetical protein